MFRSASLVLFTFLAVAYGQQVGTNTAETHPPLTWQKCTAPGSCTSQSSSVVIDANWRWTHTTSGFTNCYTGNTWDTGLYYQGTYGITSSGDQVGLKFVANGQQKNIGSRVYLMAPGSQTTYQKFNLLNQEFTFDVDLSTLPCGLNGALYFVGMDADGGMAKFPTNKAGAKYGTGYCDAQCPRDLKWIDGTANVAGWAGSDNDPNSGNGNMGTCCNEMDIWEANSISQALDGPGPGFFSKMKGSTGDSQLHHITSISNAGHNTQNNAPLTVQPPSTVPALQKPIQDKTVIVPSAPAHPTNIAVYPVDLTDPARLTTFVPLESPPAPQCRHKNDMSVPFTRIDLLEGIDRWVPCMFSFANGVTTRHYHWHFTSVIKSIFEAALEYDMEIKDELFALVVDFSDAQRLGFISAFVDCFMDWKDNTRTRAELEKAAQELIKGCKYHFEKSMTRVSRLGNHVPPESRDNFLETCRQMVETENSGVFNQLVKIMQERWPGLEAWQRWWLAPEHASMIFRSQRTMDSTLASKLPDTTNAEESLHSVIYTIAGQNKDIVPGCDGLLLVSQHFQGLYDSYSIGQPIWYGRSQRQHKLDRLAATTIPETPKRRRSSQSHTPSPRKHDRSALREGRAPDTQSDLRKSKKQKHVKILALSSSGSEDELPSSPKKAKKEQQIKIPVLDSFSSKHDKIPVSKKKMSQGKEKRPDLSAPLSIDLAITKEFASYPWSRNSCWLDTSLHLVYITLMCHGHWEEFASFAAPCAGQDPTKWSISYLHKTLSDRRAWPLSTFAGSHSEDDGSQKLQNIRDRFRHILAGLPRCLSGEETSYHIEHEYHSALYWLYYLITAPNAKCCDGPICPDAVRFFLPVIQRVSSCSEGHYQVGHPRVTNSQWQEPAARDFNLFKGNIGNWFESLFNLSSLEVPQSFEECWRHHTREGTNDPDIYCQGSCQKMEFVSWIPSVLIIRPGVSEEGKQPDWDFPCAMYLDTKSSSKKSGAVYKLVGRMFSNGTHFRCITLIPTTGGKSVAFLYDGMEHNGYAQQLKGKIADLLGGKTSLSGYHTVCSFYSLEGGVNAQKKFHQDCIKTAREKLDIQLDGTNSATLVKAGYRVMKVEETKRWKPHYSVTEYQQTDSDQQVIQSISPHSNASSGCPVTPSRTILSSSPPPSSPLPILCQCGTENDGHRDSVKQDTVQCDQCQRWSHLACLVNRLEPTIEGAFICHVCSGQSLFQCHKFMERLTCESGVRNPSRCPQGVSANLPVPFAIDSTKKMTVVTQFITNNNSTSGTLSAIRRLYVQNGKVIQQSQSAISSVTGNEIRDSFCAAQKTAFGDVNTFSQKGGMSGKFAFLTLLCNFDS
ncbi:hypothetical protein D9758_014895 [Tetrapyrgos nigripes]|uniref:cellulose 1,4-beta-cellobiosidase (non-reducing end) n=1 Tax=Tetrapyrgos nigripes TaxID=182062 RepID=A0A8H5FK92_9AGAR|nr:hypothetical protein D9758_014895 [Tetrapyrgos nigripes]